MRCTESKKLLRRPEHNNERNSLPVSAGEGLKRVLEVTAWSSVLLLRLNNYNLCKEILEHELLERDVSLKAMTASMKKLENRLGSLMKERRLLEMNN